MTSHVWFSAWEYCGKIPNTQLKIGWNWNLNPLLNRNRLFCHIGRRGARLHKSRGFFFGYCGFPQNQQLLAGKNQQLPYGHLYLNALATNNNEELLETSLTKADGWQYRTKQCLSFSFVYKSTTNMSNRKRIHYAYVLSIVTNVKKII